MKKHVKSSIPFYMALIIVSLALTMTFGVQRIFAENFQDSQSSVSKPFDPSAEDITIRKFADIDDFNPYMRELDDFVDYSFTTAKIDNLWYIVHTLKIKQEAYKGFFALPFTKLLRSYSDHITEPKLVQKGFDKAKNLKKYLYTFDPKKALVSFLSSNPRIASNISIADFSISIPCVGANAPYFGDYITLPKLEASGDILLSDDGNSYSNYSFVKREVFDRFERFFKKSKYVIEFVTTVELGNEYITFQSKQLNVSLFNDFRKSGLYIVGPIFGNNDRMSDFAPEVMATIVIAHKLDIPEDMIGKVTNISGEFRSEPLPAVF